MPSTFALLRKHLGQMKWRTMRYLRRRRDGERVLLHKYRQFHGRDLDLENPTTFTANLFRRMVVLNRRNDPLISRLADKYAVREWVRERIGGEHLVKLLWSGTDPAGIPFRDLPADFVVKSNHASGQVMLVRGSCDREAIVEQARSWLKTNIYWIAREAQYLTIKPRILVEEFLHTPDGQPPLDYRFWCFDGHVELVQVDNHDHSINQYFDTAWRPAGVATRPDAQAFTGGAPPRFDEMRKLASALSRGFEFVRVDLYNIGGRICFGEMTFTPGGGGFTFSPPEWDERLGARWA